MIMFLHFYLLLFIINEKNTTHIKRFNKNTIRDHIMLEFNIFEYKEFEKITSLPAF